MSEIPTHVQHCMLYEFQLGNNASAAAATYVLLSWKVHLLIAHAVIGSKGFEKVIYHWKIIQDPEVLSNVMFSDCKH